MLDIENQNNYDCDLPIMKSFSRLFCSKLVTCNLCTTIIFDFRNSIPENKIKALDYNRTSSIYFYHAKIFKTI